MAKYTNRVTRKEETTLNEEIAAIDAEIAATDAELNQNKTKGNLTGPSTNGLVCMADIKTEEVHWLYQPYFPRGKITLCAAYPGVGKTYLLCYLAACVSTGRSFFNLCPFTGTPGKVIYFTAEDGLGDTISQRLKDCLADQRNIYALECFKQPLLFNSPKIESYIRQIYPDLIVFDPFQSFIGSNTDMNSANKTREQLGYIVNLAAKYNVAVVIICHFNKNSAGDAITRILGSTDIVGACRSYIALGNVPGDENEGIKFMSHEKSSLSAKGKTILFRIKPEHGGIVFEGETDLTADDYATLSNKKRNKIAPASEGAKDFLVTNMPERKRPASELKNLALANGISERTLQRAAKDLGIICKREGYPSKTIWYLPDTVLPSTGQNELRGATGATGLK